MTSNIDILYTNRSDFSCRLRKTLVTISENRAKRRYNRTKFSDDVITYERQLKEKVEKNRFYEIFQWYFQLYFFIKYNGNKEKQQLHVYNKTHPNSL